MQRCLNTTINAIKTTSKRAIQKTVEETGDLINNKIGDKITSISQKSTKELPKDETKEKYVEITTHKKDTYHQKKDNKLLMN